MKRRISTVGSAVSLGLDRDLDRLGRDMRMPCSNAERRMRTPNCRMRTPNGRMRAELPDAIAELPDANAGSKSYSYINVLEQNVLDRQYIMATHRIH